MVIGRIAKLEFFNGSTIFKRERSESEKAYLRSAIRDKDDADRTGHPLSRYVLVGECTHQMSMSRSMSMSMYSSRSRYRSRISTIDQEVDMYSIVV